MKSWHLKLPITASSAASSPFLSGLRIRHKQFPVPAVPSLLLLPSSVWPAQILSVPWKERLNLSDSKTALLFLYSLWTSYGGGGRQRAEATSFPVVRKRHQQRESVPGLWAEWIFDQNSSLLLPAWDELYQLMVTKFISESSGYHPSAPYPYLYKTISVILRRS